MLASKMWFLQDMMDPVLNVVIQSSVTRSHRNETNPIQTRNEQQILLFVLALTDVLLFPSSLVDIVKPVNDVEEGKHCWEDHPRPFVNRVYVSQVWDVDF